MGSSSIVCQGLQSCLEPQVIDQSFVLRQKNLPKSSKLQETNNGGSGKMKNNSGWSFLEALENPSIKVIKNLEGKDDVYVHPMVKRSASALSSKSLEMCTESLGSETGSDVSESGDEFCSRVRAVRESKFCRGFERKIRRGEFPPPLTSISGSDGAVKVRHHREGGRLVIKAVSVSNGGTNFQAERTNGRLRLSLLRDSSVNYESGRVKGDNYESGRVIDENYESGRVKYENYEEGGGGDDDVESDDGYVSSDGDAAVAVAVAEEEEEEEGEEDGGGGGGGWRWKGGCPTGKGELKRLTRCKEGGNGNKVFANWRSSWVAIS